MTPTEMELRDQLEDAENQLADQDVMLRERDAEIHELTEQNGLLGTVLTNVTEERDMLAARVKELEARAE